MWICIFVLLALSIGARATTTQAAYDTCASALSSAMASTGSDGVHLVNGGFCFVNSSAPTCWAYKYNICLLSGGSCSFTQSTVSGACDTGNTCVAGATNHPATGVKGRLSTGDSICDHGCKESFHGDAFTQICGSSDSGATCSVSSNWTSFGTGTATGGYCDNPNSGEPAGDGTVGPAGVGGPCVGNQCYKAPAQICDGPACASAGSTSSGAGPPPLANPNDCGYAKLAPGGLDAQYVDCLGNPPPTPKPSGDSHNGGKPGTVAVMGEGRVRARIAAGSPLFSRWTV